MGQVLHTVQCLIDESQQNTCSSACFRCQSYIDPRANAGSGLRHIVAAMKLHLGTFRRQTT